MQLLWFPPPPLCNLANGLCHPLQRPIWQADYGPFGFLERFDPDFTPNTTDLPGRRYCFRCAAAPCGRVWVGLGVLYCVPVPPLYRLQPAPPTACPRLLTTLPCPLPTLNRFAERPFPPVRLLPTHRLQRPARDWAVELRAAGARAGDGGPAHRGGGGPGAAGLRRHAHTGGAVCVGGSAVMGVNRGGGSPALQAYADTLTEMGVGVHMWGWVGGWVGPYLFVKGSLG